MYDSHTKLFNNNSKFMRIIIILVITIGIGLVTFFIVNRFFNKNKTIDYQEFLENPEKDIVYSSEDSTIKDNDIVPVINIRNNSVEKINEKIMNSYQDYLGKFTDGFTYQYNVSGKILSILIKSSQRYHDATHFDFVYQTYNLDLEDFHLLTEKELFEMFNLKSEKVDYFIAYKFMNYYNDLVDKKYFSESACDFSCFLDSKGVIDFLLDNHYYIRDNHLEVYKYFNIFTEYKEQNYFTEDSFRFVIT